MAALRFFLVFCFVWNACFFNFCSSLLSTRIQETPTTEALGSIFMLSTIATDERIAQNQLNLMLKNVTESSVSNYTSNLQTAFSQKAEKTLTSLPAALFVGKMPGYGQDCTVYGWDTGSDVRFYQYCEVGDEYLSIYSLYLKFHEANYPVCLNCQDSICFGRPCAECQDQCLSEYMMVSGSLDIWNNSLATREVTTEEKEFFKSDVRKRFYDLVNRRSDFVASEDDFEFIRDSSGHISIPLNNTVVENCRGMGTGPGRHIALEINPYSFEIRYTFTPSSQVTGDPPQNMNLLCKVWIDQNSKQITTFEVRDYLNSGVSLSAVSLPFMEYRAEYPGHFYIYCDLLESQDPRNPGQTWSVRLNIDTDQGGCPVKLPGFQTCPDNADIDIRKLDNQFWEVIIVSSFSSQESIIIHNVFVDPSDCSSQVYELYKYDLTADVKSIMLPGDVTSFGDFLSVSFPKTDSIARQTQDRTDILLILNLKNTEKSWVSVLSWEDWIGLIPFESLANAKTFTSEYITSFPNNNVRLSEGSLQDVQAHAVLDGVWIGWMDAAGATGETTIYACPLGSQFVVDVSSPNETLHLRVCDDCPAGQFKNTSVIGQNCQLCPPNTYSSVPGATSAKQCLPCDGNDYCPSGMDTVTDPQSFKETTISCTSPWFEASDDVDLEGSFYINQGILIFILSMITAFLCCIVIYTQTEGSVWVASFGVWMWELEEEDHEVRKLLWGIAGFAGAVAYILLVIFILYILIGANIFIGTGVDVEDTVQSSYPDEYEIIKTAPLYFAITFYGRLDRCDKQLFDVTSVGFFDPVSGLAVLPNKTYVGAAPGSVMYDDKTFSECELSVVIPRAITSLLPQVQIGYQPGTSGSYINRVQIEVSTGIQDNGFHLKTCEEDDTVTNKDDLTKICDNPGFSYASILLRASENRALRGSADVTITKTLGVVENCKSKYNTYPWSFALTETNCEWCNSSTVLLFPSVVKSSLLESSFYYERDPGLDFTIALTEDTFARTASISRYFSFGSAILTILITGGGVLDLFALFLALGYYSYAWVYVPIMGGGGADTKSAP